METGELEKRKERADGYNRRWLPYAGITRIRFEGFLVPSSQCAPAHTPSRYHLYQASLG